MSAVLAPSAGRNWRLLGRVSLPRAHALGPAWLGYLLVLMLVLTLPTLKVPISVDLRLGQIVLVLGFAVLALRDLVTGEARWGILLALVGCGVLLCGISYVAPFFKTKQAVFFVKYLFLFPAAFYVGARLMSNLPPRRVAQLLEVVLLSACSLAVLLEFVPIPLLIHERPEGLADGLKGTFWEQAGLAFFIGLFMLASIALRLGYDVWPEGRRRRETLYLLYAFAIGCGLATENKTLWLALVGAMMIAGLLYRPLYGNPVAARRWGIRLVVASVFALIVLAAYNAYLPIGDKLVTVDGLRAKWRTERGEALRVAWDLILNHPWMGHGFGFVESYFGTWSIGVVGLGSGVAQIFNSYIDMWVSVGIIGLVYALTLVWVCFDRRVLFSTFVVAYLFAFANVNPVAQLEFYHLFLGGAFGLARWPGGTKPAVVMERKVADENP